MILAHITTVPLTLGFIRGQVDYMQRQGFEIHAVSSPSEELVAFGSSQQIEAHAVEMPRKVSPLHDLSAVRQLIRVLRTLRPIIVHAHTPKGGLLGMISAWLARVPVRIYHIRGMPYMTATGRRRILLKTTERISCKLAHKVFCVSHSIRDVAIRDGICPAEKIVVFGGGSGNGVDSSGRFKPAQFSRAERNAMRQRFGIQDNALVIGFVGRIVRDKGVEDLSAAWSSIRQSYPFARLVFVGPLEPQDAISKDTLATLMGDKRVLFTGSVADTSTMYPVFDLVVLPTYREGFPNVPLEAAAMELAVVATDIPGCIDAIRDGVTGTLVPPRDAKALRIAIERYLDDPELRERHGRAGRERVLREFRQEDIWKAIYQEYTRLLRAKGIAVPAVSNGSETA